MIDMPQSVTSVNGMTGDVVIVGSGGLADPGSNGILARTALNTTSARTLTGTANQITVTNGDGVSGNPTLSLPQDIHTGASPTFAAPTFTGNLTMTGVTGQNIFQTSGATAQWSSFGNKLYFTNASFGSNAGVNFGININDGAASETRFIIDRVSNTGGYSTNLFKIQTNTAVATFYGNLTPNADSTHTLGTSSLYWSNTYTDRLYLNSTAYLDGGTAGAVGITGNVGIGVTAPGAKLQVDSTVTTTVGAIIKGAAAQTADLLQIQDSAANKLMVVSSGGNVGIGSAAPYYRLEVNGANTQATGITLLSSGSDALNIYSSGANTDIYMTARRNYSSNLYMGVVGKETALTVQATTGNVGIGTTSPGEKLEVSGTVKATGYKSSDGSAGVSGSFTTTDGKTITIKDGLVVSIL